MCTSCGCESVYMNSFVGKTNCYSKMLCVAVSKQLTLYDQETTDQYVVDYEVLTV